MEKILKDPLVNFLERNNFLAKYQHGFRKGKSCVTQLLECMEKWTSALENDNAVDIVYLDFKAAFEGPTQKAYEKSLGFRYKGKTLLLD